MSLYKDYKKIGKLGEGSYGVVFKVVHRQTNKLFAIKKRSMDAEGVPQDVIREASMLQELKDHANVVTLHEIIMTKNHIYFVLDLEDNDLSRIVIPENKIESYVKQLLSAIDYCHTRRIMHRDIALKNILVSANRETVKLTDFGLSRVFLVPVRPYTHEVCTLHFRAPEIILGSQTYTYPSDIWSLGCVFVTMWKKSCLFSGETEIDQLMCIFRVAGTPTEKTWQGVQTFPGWMNEFPSFSPNLSVFDCVPTKFRPVIDGMLVLDPHKRISPKQAMLLMA